MKASPGVKAWTSASAKRNCFHVKGLGIVVCVMVQCVELALGSFPQSALMMGDEGWVLSDCLQVETQSVWNLPIRLD